MLDKCRAPNTRSPKSHRLLRDRCWMAAHYIRSQAALAAQLGCAPVTVSYWLRRHGIPALSKFRKRVAHPKDGYRHVLRDGRKIREHRWVMEQRLGRRLRPDEHVHHDDRDRLNNADDNLVLLPPARHNRLSGADAPRPPALRGSRNPMAKLTEAQVKAIKRALQTGRRGTQLALARRYGVSPPKINQIAKGRAWAHVS